MYYLHELGHKPQRIEIRKWFPPRMAAMNAKSRFGGLIVNSIIFLGIFFLRPENIYLQVFGALNFFYVVLYMFFGSFNYEVDLNKVAPSIREYIVLDDVPNIYWYIFIPLSIITFLVMRSYYVPIIVRFFTG